MFATFDEWTNNLKHVSMHDTQISCQGWLGTDRNIFLENSIIIPMTSFAAALIGFSSLPSVSGQAREINSDIFSIVQHLLSPGPTWAAQFQSLLFEVNQETQHSWLDDG